MDAAVDTFSVVWFVGLFFGLPALGWLMMVVDYRAYVRGLRRALVVVRRYTLEAPLWSLRDRPECLKRLGLLPGCTREEVMVAYRRCVKEVHPDRGGDRRRFDQLQRWLSEALTLVEDSETAART